MTVVVLAVLALCGTAIPARGAPAQRITHGPLLGHVEARAIWIWARSRRAGTLRIRYGQASALDRWSAPVPTRPERDNAAWVSLTGLAPDTVYHYQPVVDGNPGPRGRFRTLPDPEGLRDPAINPRGLFNFSFEFGSCNNQDPKNGLGPAMPAFRTMLRQLGGQVHFSIMNGDWIYEDGRDYTVASWARETGIASGAVPSILQLAPSLVGVWQNYKLYLERSPALAAWHREIPSYFTPDDHEILSDVAGAGMPGVRDRRAVFRDIALRGWYDYVAGSNPVLTGRPIFFGRTILKNGQDELVDPQADFSALSAKDAGVLHVHWGGPKAGLLGKTHDVDGDPNAGVYEIVEVTSPHRLRIRPAPLADGPAVYSIGRPHHFQFRVGNVHFFMLDTRGERDRIDPADPKKPGSSMLGRRQIEWLTRAMQESDADFLIVTSSVNLMIPHVGGGGPRGQLARKSEAWSAFSEERERLIRFWDTLGKPVLVLTGDLHNSFVVKVTDRIWEMASGPHNSANHIAASEGGRPPNGPFTSEGRPSEIRWSSYVADEVPDTLRRFPVFAVAQVNNVFSRPTRPGEVRWSAYPVPHIVVRYHDGLTGAFLYAEAVHASPRR